MASRSTKKAGCPHKPSSICSSCQREQRYIPQMGAWAKPGSNPTDYESFVRDNPEALPSSKKASTSKTSTQPQTPSKKPTQPPTSTTNSKSQRPDKHFSSSLTLRQQLKSTTPTSSVVATRGNSPVTHRTTIPVYSPRQAVPATTNAAVFARGDPRALTPQTASRPGAYLPRRHVAPVYESESETESGESEDSSDDE